MPDNVNQNDVDIDIKQLIRLVGLFATPFALTLGVCGVVAAGIEFERMHVCLGLLGFSAVLNILFPRMISQQDSSRHAPNVRVRMSLNIIVNALLVYFLSPVFPAIWLILTLVPFATAIYGDRKDTIQGIVTSGAILISVQVLYGSYGLTPILETLVRIAFITLIALMINALARLVPRPDNIL